MFSPGKSAHCNTHIRTCHTASNKSTYRHRYSATFGLPHLVCSARYTGKQTYANICDSIYFCATTAS